MAIGNHTFWVIVVDDEAICDPKDQRICLRFVSPEAAKAYGERHLTGLLPGWWKVVKIAG